MNYAVHILDPLICCSFIVYCPRSRWV